MSDPRYRSSFGFIDLLFNMLIGFVFLFMLAFLLINPVAKKETIKPKAEYFIELEDYEKCGELKEHKDINSYYSLSKPFVTYKDGMPKFREL